MREDRGRSTEQGLLQQLLQSEGPRQGHRPGGVSAQFDTLAQFDARIQLRTLIQFNGHPRFYVLVAVIGRKGSYRRHTHCDCCGRRSCRYRQQHAQEEPGEEVPGCAGAAVASGKHSYAHFPPSRLPLSSTGRPTSRPTRLLTGPSAVSAAAVAGTGPRSAISTEPSRLRRLLRLRLG